MIEDVLARLQVAAIAFIAQTPSVHIVFGVTAFCRAGSRCSLKFLLRMALNAFRDPIVQTEQWPIRIVCVIESRGEPGPGLVATIALIAEATDRPGGIDPATGIAGLDLQAAVERLEPDDRALLALRYVMGFNSTELAAATGLSPAGVRTRLKRLLDQLRRELM